MLPVNQVLSAGRYGRRRWRGWHRDAGGTRSGWQSRRACGADGYNSSQLFNVRSGAAPGPDSLPGSGVHLPRARGFCFARPFRGDAKNPRISAQPSQSSSPPRFSPNPPMETDGRREDTGRGVRKLQKRWSGLDSGRREVGGGLQALLGAPGR